MPGKNSSKKQSLAKNNPENAPWQNFSEKMTGKTSEKNLKRPGKKSLKIDWVKKIRKKL